MFGRAASVTAIYTARLRHGSPIAARFARNAPRGWFQKCRVNPRGCRTLARAHARSGDPAAIAGYMGKSEVMDDAIASFAMTYAAQTTIDHAALVRAKTNQDGNKLKLVAA